MNDGLFLWDINWLHYLILSARINKGFLGCETSALFIINSRAHAAQSQFLRFPLSTSLAGPHDALFSHKYDRRRAIPVQRQGCAAREGLASFINRCKIA